MVIKKGKKEKLVVKTNKGNNKAIIERQPNDVRNNIDQLFDQFRSNFNDLFWGPENRMIIPSMDIRTPLMDVVDLGDKYEMKVEIPGIQKEDINIEVTPNEVEISAENNYEEEDKGKNWLRKERSATSFYRYLELPEALKTKDIDAQFKDGMLTLTLPKVEPKPQPELKKVKIK
jgi:HSP20 family protein